MKLKGEFYRTLVRPTRLHGSECWAVKKNSKKGSVTRNSYAPAYDHVGLRGGIELGMTASWEVLEWIPDRTLDMAIRRVEAE